MDDLMILNLDDYHNIHAKRRADTTTTSEVHHFQTILLKGAPGIPAPPFNNPFTDKNIHNPKGIDHNLIIENVQESIFPHLWLTYNERKLFFTKDLREATNHEERVEMLLVHSYDSRIRQRREDRSMTNTKLVNLVEGSLHSTRDYVKAVNNLLDVPELDPYLGRYALPASLDYPGQFNLRRAISNYLNSGNTFNISPLLLHIIPMIGPLHVSLNSRETVLMLNHAFFNKLYCEIYMKKNHYQKNPCPIKLMCYLN